MGNNRLGELPWLIDIDTGRPSGVKTQRNEEIGVMTVLPPGAVPTASDEFALTAGQFGAARNRSNPLSFIARVQGGPRQSSNVVQTATGLLVLSCPVPYYAVRVHYEHLGGNGPVTGFSALIGASDDIGSQDFTDISAAAFKRCVTPRAGGTEYNTVVTDGSPGWKSVTWAGASTASIADPGAGRNAYVSSDVIYESARLDTANNCYPLLIRHWFGSAGLTFTNNLTGRQTANNWITDAGLSRPFICLQRSGDSVTTPANWGFSNTPSLSSSAPNVYVEFFTAAGVRTVQMVGDSRFGVSAEFSATKNYLSTEFYVNSALQSAGVPVLMVRNGISGAGVTKTNANQTTEANYWINAQTPQKIGASGWLVYLIYSINDGNLTDGLTARCIGRAIEYAAAARANGQRILFLTCFPANGGFTAPQFANIATIRAFAQQAGDAVIDPLALYGNASGAYAQFSFDGVHMVDAGYRDLAARIAAAVAK